MQPSQPWRPVFIVGAPRSGTTLIQQLLSREVAIGPETHFVRNHWLRRRRYGDLRRAINWTRLKRDIVASDPFVDSGLDGSLFDTVERTYPAILRRWIEGYAHHQGLALMGEKTPNHAQSLELLSSWYPGARFVHVVRDPRAVVSSSLQTPWSTNDPAADANVWRSYVCSVRRAQPILGSRCLTIVYEDLVANPDDLLAQLAEFVGVEVSALEPGGAPVGVNLAREPWKAGSSLAVSAASVDKWATALTLNQVRSVEAVAGAEMQLWGYAPLTPLRDRIPAVLRHLGPLLAHQLVTTQRRIRL